MNAHHYRYQSTTRGPGIEKLVGGLSTALIGGLFCYFVKNEISQVVGALLFIAAAVGLVIGAKHLRQPMETFIEVTQDHIVWRDVYYLGTREWSVPLRELKEIVWGGDDGPHYFILESCERIALTGIFKQVDLDFVETLHCLVPEADVSGLRRIVKERSATNR